MDNASYPAPRWITYLILPLLGALLAVWVGFKPPAKVAGPVRLRMNLPETLGPYTGQLILHCQNSQCRQSFPVPSEDALVACPSCGGALLPMALSEKQMLPPDTRIARRLYQAPGQPFYSVTIVLAGSDPRSIHRPQQCLPAQGTSIDRQHSQTLTLAPNRNLTLMVLDTRRGGGPEGQFGFAYWFVGPNSETHSHYVRLFRTTYDHLFRNTVSHWAYVAITSSEPLNTPESLARFTEFLQLLVPAIEITPPA
jgi:hypothetical protein